MNGARSYDVVVGVDPGYRDTGWVILRGRELVACGTVHRAEPAIAGCSLTAGDYLDDVVGSIEAELDAALVDKVDLVAVEDIVCPTPHLGMTNSTGIIGAAIVVGYVLSWARDLDPATEVVTVRPGRNGSGPSGLYPPELLDRGGIARPGGARRHERSALDVARVFAGYRP